MALMLEFYHNLGVIVKHDSAVVLQCLSKMSHRPVKIYLVRTTYFSKETSFKQGREAYL